MIIHNHEGPRWIIIMIISVLLPKIICIHLLYVLSSSMMTIHRKIKKQVDFLPLWNLGKSTWVAHIICREHSQQETRQFLLEITLKYIRRDHLPFDKQCNKWDVKHSPSYSQAKWVTLELTTHDHVPNEPYPSLGSPQASSCGQKINSYRCFFVIINDDGPP